MGKNIFIRVSTLCSTTRALLNGHEQIHISLDVEVDIQHLKRE